MTTKHLPEASKEITALMALADIRSALGVGDTPMLSELAGIVRKQRESLEQRGHHLSEMLRTMNTLLDENAKLRTMLKRLEWGYTDCPEAGSCPLCQAWGNEGHFPDCELAKLIHGEVEDAE